MKDKSSDKNKIKIGRLQSEKSRNMFERIQIMKKSCVFTVLYSVQHVLYTVTPLTCYLLHAASLMRFGLWSLPSTLLKAKECNEVA